MHVSLCRLDSSAAPYAAPKTIARRSSLLNECLVATSFQRITVRRCCADDPDKITPELVREHGLTDEEYARIKSLLGREPTLVELGIFSVMWSEHCSYKSTRAYLRNLPTKAPWVLQGPGENAGVIDIGDGDAAIFKMESHNHPSFIEPYQGAATGVGGIMRDVFTMGARPIAMMNALRFGDPSHPKTRHLVSGVVSRHRRLRQLHGRAHGGRRSEFPPLL